MLAPRDRYSAAATIKSTQFSGAGFSLCANHQMFAGHGFTGCGKGRFREGFSSTATPGCAVFWAYAHPGRDQSIAKIAQPGVAVLLFPQPF